MRWRKEYKEDKLPAFPGNGRMSDKDAEIAILRQENRRLLTEQRFKNSEGIVRSTNVRENQFILEH